MKALLVRLGQFLVGTIGSAFLNLILIPVMTYFLTPTEYGKTSMFILAQTLLTYVIYLGFDQAFTREFHDYSNKTNLMRQAMLVPLLFSGALIILAIGLASIISTGLFAASHYRLAVYLLAISAVFLIFERFILLYVRMKNQAVIFSAYSILVKFMILVGTLFALFIGPPTFMTVVYGMLGGQISGDIVLIILSRNLFKGPLLPLDSELLQKLARFGLPVAIGTFLYSLLVIIDKLFLRYFTNFQQLGIYTAAFKIASALMVIQVSFGNFWIPTAYEWYKQKKPIIYYEWVSQLVLFILAFCFLLMLWFKRWIMMILSPAYLEAQYIFPLLCFYPLMMTLSETTNLGIVFLRKSMLNIYVSLIASVVAIVLNIILDPLYGAKGAAIATSAAYVVFFFARTFFSMHVWQGFAVRRQVWMTLLLYSFTLWSSFNHDIKLERVIITGLMLFLLFYTIMNGVCF